MLGFIYVIRTTLRDARRSHLKVIKEIETERYFDCMEIISRII